MHAGSLRRLAAATSLPEGGSCCRQHTDTPPIFRVVVGADPYRFGGFPSVSAPPSTSPATPNFPDRRGRRSLRIWWSSSISASPSTSPANPNFSGRPGVAHKKNSPALWSSCTELGSGFAAFVPAPCQVLLGIRKEQASANAEACSFGTPNWEAASPLSYQRHAFANANAARFCFAKLAGCHLAKSCLIYEKEVIALKGHDFFLVHRTGLEPAAPSVGGWCSIQLSYRCVQRPYSISHLCSFCKGFG